jgi:hypothetical protein
MRTRALASALASALVAGCAPDAVIPSKPFDAFLAQIAEACRGKAIGAWTVDQLVRRSHGFTGGYFIDQTSRLYFARINTQDWAAGVSAFVRGTQQDPGIECVIAEYRQVQQWTTPTGEAPARDAPAAEAPPRVEPTR